MTFGISAGTLIAAGAAVAGGAIAANGSKSAAKTQADAANQSNQTNLDIFNKQTELQEPFRQNGIAATNRLSFLLGLPQPQGGQPQAAPSGTGQGGQASQGNPFAPHPEIPQAQAQGPVTEQNFNAQAYLAANPDVAQFIQAHPGSATPWEHYNQHGRDEGRSLGLPTQASAQTAPPGWNEQAYLQANPDVAQAVARGETTALGHFLASGQAEGRSPSGNAPAPGQGPQNPTGNDMTGFGSLNQQFSQTDYQADGAPKFAPFTQTPNLPTFNQQAPDVAQFAQRAPAQQLGQFQSRPELSQYGGAQTLSSFKGTPDLSGFEDMPAFSADMMKDDPGYQFRLSEGLKGLDHTAAARGGALSGAAIKGAERFGQDYASNEFGNSFNRYQTQRGNKLQDYLTNQNTDQANRANAVQDFGLNQNTAQLNNANQLQTFMTNQNTQQANRTNAVQDYTTNRQTGQQNIDNGVRDFNDNLGVQQQNYTNQRGAYDTNFNQFQVGRANAVNDNKDALNVYSLNRANGLQDYQSAYDRFQTNRGNVINPLLSLMGAGQQATNQQSNAAQNFGAQSAAAVTAAGNARAAGQVGSANAINSGIGGATNAFQQNQLMNLLLSRNQTGVNMGSASGADSSLFFQ